MKKTLIILFLAFCVLSLNAQIMHTKDKKAISYYKKAMKLDNSIDEKIDYLYKAFERDPNFIEARSSLAELLYRQGRYADAVEVSNAEKYRVALQLYNDSVDIHPRRVQGVNTRFNDYFPSITADGRMMSTTVLDDKECYKQENLYFSIAKPDGNWTVSLPVGPPINTPDNEGAQSFSSDGRYMFYVRCNTHDNIGSCDIWYSIRRGNKWSYPMNLGAPANTEYWETNPVMSPSGDELYFVSNRPGGLGGSDIWKVKIRILKDGRLEPYKDQPLGAPVNTEKDDFAPFLHADGKTLYFASHGHFGLGGSDIYMSRMDDNGRWGKPVNLGYPINTNGDESGFVVSGDGTKGYYASDKVGGESETLMDIFEIDMPQDKRPERVMKYSPGRVYDAVTSRPLEAYIEIFEQADNHKWFESLSDASRGDFVAILPEDGSYGLSVRREGYFFYSKEIRHAGDSIQVALQPIEQGSKTTIENLFFDTDKDEILPTSFAVIEHLAEFMRVNKKVIVEIVGHTDNVGSEAHNNDLSLRRAEALRNALIAKGIAPERMTVKGMGAKQPVADNNTEEGRALNRRVEMIIK